MVVFVILMTFMLDETVICNICHYYHYCGSAGILKTVPGAARSRGAPGCLPLPWSTDDSQSLNHDISAVLYPTFCKNRHLYLLEISSHWSISSAVVAGLNFNLYKQHVRSFSPRDSSTRGFCRAYTLTTHPKHATSTIKTRYSRDVNKSAGK